jgi:NADPH-dependent glutamate synthase beta subunit-like oxidoreductase
MTMESGDCFYCGEPTCRTACPLHNRIPEWLMQAAKGRIEAAAEIMRNAVQLEVPSKVDTEIGPSWGEAKG